MAMVGVYISPNGDGSYSNSIQPTPVMSVEIENTFGNEIPSATVRIKRNLNVKEGNEIRMYKSPNGFINANPQATDRIFRGFIDKITTDGIVQTLSCSNYLILLKNRVSQQNFDVKADGTQYQIPQIITSLVTEAMQVTNPTTKVVTSLPSPITANVNDISLPNFPLSVLNIISYDCTNQNIFERIINLCEMIDAYFYYDASTNIVYFKRRTGGTAYLLELGPKRTNNIIGIPSWTGDASNVVTNAIVSGGTYYDNYDVVMTTDDNLIFENFDIIPIQYNDYSVSKVTAITMLQATFVYKPNQITILDRSSTTNGGGISIQLPALCISCKVTLTKQITGVTQSAAVSPLIYGVRDQASQSKDFGALSDIINFVTNLVNNWKKSTLTVTLKTSVTGLIGRGININDDLNKRYYHYGGAADSTQWYGVVVKERYSFPNYGTELTIEDHVIKNPSMIAILNKNSIDSANNLAKLSVVNNVKTDGTTNMAGNLNVGGNQLLNAQIHNVTSLGK